LHGCREWKCRHQLINLIYIEVSQKVNMVPYSKNLTKIFQKNPRASILWLGKKCELKAREFLFGHILSLFHENRDYLHNLTQ
jgi:hypothetical protein